MCTAFTGESFISPTLKRLLLTENEFAFSISPFDLRSKQKITLVIKNNLLKRDLAVVIDSIWKSTGSEARATKVMFVYVVAVETSIFYISNPAQYINLTTTLLTINKQQIKSLLRQK